MEWLCDCKYSERFSIFRSRLSIDPVANHFLTQNVFRINTSTNQLGYDEVVDTLADSITVYRKISEPLRDGFQFPDLLSLYDAYPHLREMYDDRRTFAAQFIDLTAEESIAVLDELSVRTGVPRDRVEQVAFRAFSVAGRTCRFVRHNLAEIQDIREEVLLSFRTEQGRGIGLLNAAAWFSCFYA